MRNKFENQLKELNDSLILMGALCEDCITYATQTLLTGNPEMGKNANQMEKDIDEKEREIQSLCMKMLLQQQPVARDLRTISAALKMITDMERIGDQGADIADIVRHIDLTKSRNTVHIAEMADAVIRMVIDAVGSFVKKDKNLAESVQTEDDKVDELFQRIKAELIEMICGGTTHSAEIAEQALETLMVAKYFERIGDHTVNIAESVLYMLENNPNVEL